MRGINIPFLNYTDRGMTMDKRIVPYHSKAMKKGLEQAVLKEAGLK